MSQGSSRLRDLLRNENKLVSSKYYSVRKINEEFGRLKLDILQFLCQQSSMHDGTVGALH